ncbi:EAL domain-containing protein, partial [Candidatus Magnetaquicoccus inordinatus]|uniref:EAL domain-containing protein n=1 Tax=Candidatus Magnetaquicoccus inordinatus TaxID=2496818 RepID=UPI00187D1063
MNPFLQSMPFPRRLSPLLLVGVITSLLLWSGGAWWITGMVALQQLEKTAEQAQQELDSSSAKIELGIRRGLAVLHAVPAAVGQHKQLRQQLARLSALPKESIPPSETLKRSLWSADPELQELNLWLERFNASLGITSALWVINTQGETIAASNARQTESFVGTNFSDREYFQEAMAGRLGNQYAVGRRTNIPGLFFSAPIKVDGELLGVVASKVDLSFLSSWLEQNDAFLSDRYGVIILARNKKWELHTLPDHNLGALTASERLARYKQSDFDSLRMTPWNGPYPGFQLLADNPNPVLLRTLQIPEEELSITVATSVPLLLTISDNRQIWFWFLQTVGLLMLLLALYRWQMQQQRRESEHALRSSQSKLSAIVRNSPIGIAILRLQDLQIMEANPAFSQLYGCTPQELTGRQASQLPLWHHRDAVEQLLQPLKQGERVQEWEGHLPTETAQERIALWSAEPLDFDYTPCFLAMVMEITQRKQMEELLQENNRHLELLVAERTHELSEGMEQLQREIIERQRAEERNQRALREQRIISELLHVNLQPVTLESLLRTALQGILSLPWLNLLTQGIIFLKSEKSHTLLPVVIVGMESSQINCCSAHCQPSNCLCQQTLHSGAMLHFLEKNSPYPQQQPLCGTAIESHLLLPIAGQGETLGVLRLFPNPFAPAHTKEALDFLTTMSRLLAEIILRKQAEERGLLAAKVFAMTQEAIMVTDSKNRIIDINPAFSKITQYSREEALRQDPGFMKSGRHDYDFYAQMWREILQHGHWHGEIWDRRKDGELYPKWLTIDTLRDEEGEIVQCIGVFSDISELKLAEDKLRALAMHDPLTGLANRNQFLPVLEQAVKSASRWRRSLALLLFDLDRFKVVNDTHGHPVGDLLLQQVAARVRACLRDSDMVARLGGDEFAIIVEQSAHAHHIAEIARKVVESLAQPFSLNGIAANIAASMGVAFYPDDAADDQELIRKADAASYHAKQHGGNSFHFFSPEMEKDMQERFRLENDLLQGMKEGRFVLYYQPQIDPATHKVGGVEALLRLHDSSGALNLPSTFLRIAEESGLIVLLGEWVLRTACQQGKSWLDAGIMLPKLAVNVSGRQFLRRDFSSMVAGVLQESGFPAHKLELELTESFLIRDMAVSRSIMEELRAMGIRLTLDDFGTDHSSFGYLQQLPVDGIKLPREYTAGCAHNPFNASFSWAVLALAEQKGIKVVVEGVEQEEDISFFRGLSASLVQGFYFAHPMPGNQLQELLKVDGELLGVVASKVDLSFLSSWLEQ